MAVPPGFGFVWQRGSHGSLLLLENPLARRVHNLGDLAQLLERLNGQPVDQFVAPEEGKVPYHERYEGP